MRIAPLRVLRVVLPTPAKAGIAENPVQNLARQKRGQWMARMCCVREAFREGILRAARMEQQIERSEAAVIRHTRLVLEACWLQGTLMQTHRSAT